MKKEENIIIEQVDNILPEFVNNKIPYMNFKIKLTIGIKASNKHVQYCVNKINMI